MLNDVEESELDTVVAKVANRAFVGVVDVELWIEITIFDGEPNLFVGIAEWSSFGSKSINFFDRVHEFVSGVASDVGVYFNVVEHASCHVEDSDYRVEGGEERFFDELEVAEVAGGEIVGNQCDFHGESLQFVAFGSSQFKHVGVFLVRHNRRAGGELVGEFDEAEVLGIEHASVEGEFANRSGDRSDSIGNNTLGFTAAHLSVNDVVVHGFKAEEVGGHGAVERERGAVAGSRAERVSVGDFVGGAKNREVVDEAFGISTKP